MAILLELEGIVVRLRDSLILDGLDLTMAAGECRALVGLNGAGKTTTLRVILDMLTPTAGSARLLGHWVACATGAVWARVGHLVDSPFCYPELTGRENIECSAYLHGADPRRSHLTARRMAEALGMSNWLDTPARRMSLGTRQKVGLISALSHEPDFVVLDEPTNGLDPLAVVAFRQLLTELTERGGSALVTSHHFDELARVADHVDVLHHGHVIDSLRPDGRDLERTFFDTILAADQALLDTP